MGTGSTVSSGRSASGANASRNALSRCVTSTRSSAVIGRSSAAAIASTSVVVRSVIARRLLLHLGLGLPLHQLGVDVLEQLGVEHALRRDLLRDAVQRVQE